MITTIGFSTRSSIAVVVGATIRKSTSHELVAYIRITLKNVDQSMRHGREPLSQPISQGAKDIVYIPAVFF
jgi:hypothetical protein